MQVAPYRGGQLNGRHYAAAAVGGLYNQAARSLLRQAGGAARRLWDQYSVPFPTRTQLKGYTTQTMKRTRYSNGNGRAAKRTYIPRGVVQWNRRTGGFVNRPELKWFDQAFQKDYNPMGAPIENVSFLMGDNFTTPPQGVASNERTGRRFHIKSLQVNALIYMGHSLDGTSPLGSYWATIYFVLDKQTNKTNLATTTGAANLIMAQNSNERPLINLENTDRFRILKQKKVFLQPGNNQTAAPNVTAVYSQYSGNQVANINMYMKCNIDVLTEPTSALGGAAATMDNSVYLVVHFGRRKAADIAVNNAPYVIGHTRVRFCC